MKKTIIAIVCVVVIGVAGIIFYKLTSDSSTQGVNDNETSVSDVVSEHDSVESQLDSSSLSKEEEEKIIKDAEENGQIVHENEVIREDDEGNNGNQVEITD